MSASFAANESLLPNGNKIFEDSTKIILGSTIIGLVTFLLAIVFVKKKCSRRKYSGRNEDIKSAITKINAKVNEEQYLISYQFDTAKPDMLNKGDSFFQTPNFRESVLRLQCKF